MKTPVIEFVDADIPRGRASSRATLLQGVSWRVDPGDFWVVGGMAGRGKTDLLCTAAALQRPVKGYHSIFGKDTQGMDEQDLVTSHRKVAMVFDSGRLFPNLSVAENLALPLAYHQASQREVADRVARVLEATRLQAFRDRRPGEITRNLHQRVGLARALALNPEALLIDSPLLGIDQRQCRWWLEFLRQLNQGHAVCDQRPLTIIASTDDFRPWTEVAKCFAVIKETAFQVVGGRAEMQSTSESAVQEMIAPSFESD